MTKREFLALVLIIVVMAATCIIAFDLRAEAIQSELAKTNQQLQELNIHLKKIAGN
jgi:peptidoglycan hydrolase CwlO-like protein